MSLGIFSIIAYDRATIQSILNHVIPHGGVREIRIMKMSNSTYFSDLINEQALVHNFDQIVTCNLKDLLGKNDESPEVVIISTGSQQSIDDYKMFSSSLLNLIAKEICTAKHDSIKFVFGDNTRGLLQKACFEMVLVKSGLDLKKFQSVALSSVFQMSKVLNAEESGLKLRCYPKFDGSIYVYDPLANQTEKETEDLSKELKMKLTRLEILFSRKTCDNYPNVEGIVFSRFLKTYKQSGWEVALGDEELYSRRPTKEEVAYYGLEKYVPIFLPSWDEDEQVPEYLPEVLKNHVKSSSVFIASTLSDCGD